MITISILYTAQIPKAQKESEIVSGQRGTLRVKFTFSEDWDPYPVRTALFSSRAAARTVLIDPDGYATIPASVIANGVRSITVSVFGNAENNDGSIHRYNGRPVGMRVEIGGAVPCEKGEDPTAYETLLIRVMAVDETIAAIQDEISGKLDENQGAANAGRVLTVEWCGRGTTPEGCQKPTLR